LLMSSGKILVTYCRSFV